MKTIREQVASKCVHFTGYQNGQCKASVNYRALVGGPDLGWAVRLPCVVDSPLSKHPIAQCKSFRLPSEEEIQRELYEIEEMFKRVCKRSGI